MRILVIESLEVIFEGLKSYFNHHCASSELFWANSPEKAEKMLKEEAYDLLLTELDFEQLDGLELIENLCLRFRLKSVIYTASRNKFRTKWLNNNPFSISNIIIIDCHRMGLLRCGHLSLIIVLITTPLPVICVG